MELDLFQHLNTQFEKLTQRVQELTASKQRRPVLLSSDMIDQLGVALAKAQAEMPIAGLNKTNPYFKSTYADLQSIVSASRPALTKYGLAITQVLYDDEDGASWIKTILIHGASSQWVASQKRVVPLKNDIQSISSQTTYLKRLTYAALIGVVSGDEDDDGEAAVATTRETYAKGTALNTNYDPKAGTPDVISADQLDQLEYELQSYPDIANLVLEGLKLQNLADMPKSKFLAAIERVRKIKRLREEGK